MIEKINDISELKSRKGIADANTEVLGYYQPGDLGGGNFYWDADSVEDEDNGTIFSVENVTTGRWKRRLAGPVHLSWFGTKGDSTTDETQKLNAALEISRLNNLPLFIPRTSGYYLVSSPLIVGCDINSDGAVIKAATNNFHLLNITAASNLTIENLNLEYLTPQATIQSIGFCPIFIDNSSNITVKNVHVVNGGSFYMEDSTDLLIDNCSIIRANYMGFFLTRCTRSKVINSYAEKVVTSYRTEQCYDIEFVNNHAYDNWGDAVRIEDTQRCKVIGNTFRKCYGGMGVYGPHSGFSFDTKDVIFTENILEDCFYSETEIPNAPVIMLPNIVKGAMNTKSHCDNTLFTSNLVRSNFNSEIILVPTIANTVFTFPGWETAEVRTDTLGNSNFLLTRYGNYIYAVDTDPISVSNRREGSWYYVNFDSPVDLNNTKFTIDFYVQTVTLMPGVFEIRLYSGVDRTNLIGSLPMYNAGIANCPLSIIFNTAGLAASSVSCIEFYCIKDEITDPDALTPALVAMGEIRKGLDQRIGFWHSNLNTQPTNTYFSDTNTFINVEIPILHKRVGADTNPIIYTDRLDDFGPQSNRPLNVPDGYRYYNTDNNKQEVRYNNQWRTWVDGSWDTWPNPPTLNDVLLQGNTSSQPIIQMNQSFRAAGSSASNGYSFFDVNNNIRWLLGKLANVDLAFYRYDSSGAPIDRIMTFTNSNGKIAIGSNSTAISTLDVRGSLTLNHSSVSVDTILTDANLAINCTTTSGPIVIGLPAASTCFGRIYIIKKVTSDANTVTIDPDGSDLVDNQASVVLPGMNDNLVLQSTGSSWNVVSKRADATTTARGHINTTTQSFAGLKTFTGGLSSAGLVLSIASTKTGNYSATTTDYTIPVDSTSGSITITLPTTVPAGQIFVVKKLVAANTVTLDPTGSVTIDGQPNLAITAQWGTATVQFDGTNYIILNS